MREKCISLSLGAQERPVPATNGARPLAPVGRHSSQFGALLDRAVVPLADPPPEPLLPDVVPPPVAPDRDPAPKADPVEELPAVEPPAVAPPVVALPVVVAVAAAEFVAVAVPAALVIVGRLTPP